MYNTGSTGETLQAYPQKLWLRSTRTPTHTARESPTPTPVWTLANPNPWDPDPSERHWEQEKTSRS